MDLLFKTQLLYFCVGKDGRDLCAQLSSGRVDEMHQEPDGEPHHWTASTGDQRHVFGFGPQVNYNDNSALREMAACDYICCLKSDCGIAAFVTTTEAASLYAMMTTKKCIFLWFIFISFFFLCSH